MVQRHQRLDGELLHRIQVHGLISPRRLPAAACAALISWPARITLRIPAAAPSTKNTNRKTGLGVVAEMAEQPVNPPSQSAPDDQRRDQFGRETPGDAQLGRRRPLGRDRMTLLGFVEPLAQLAQFVGILEPCSPP